MSPNSSDLICALDVKQKKLTFGYKEGVLTIDGIKIHNNALEIQSFLDFVKNERQRLVEENDHIERQMEELKKTKCRVLKDKEDLEKQGVIIRKLKDELKIQQQKQQDLIDQNRELHAEIEKERQKLEDAADDLDATKAMVGERRHFEKKFEEQERRIEHLENQIEKYEKNDTSLDEITKKLEKASQELERREEEVERLKNEIKLGVKEEQTNEQLHAVLTSQMDVIEKQQKQITENEERITNLIDTLRLKENIEKQMNETMEIKNDLEKKLVECKNEQDKLRALNVTLEGEKQTFDSRTKTDKEWGEKYEKLLIHAGNLQKQNDDINFKLVRNENRIIALNNAYRDIENEFITIQQNMDVVKDAADKAVKTAELYESDNVKLMKTNAEQKNEIEKCKKDATEYGNIAHDNALLNDAVQRQNDLVVAIRKEIEECNLGRKKLEEDMLFAEQRFAAEKSDMLQKHHDYIALMTSRQSKVKDSEVVKKFDEYNKKQRALLHVNDTFHPNNTTDNLKRFKLLTFEEYVADVYIPEKIKTAFEQSEEYAELQRKMQELRDVHASNLLNIEQRVNEAEEKLKIAEQEHKNEIDELKNELNKTDNARAEQVVYINNQKRLWAKLKNDIFKDINLSDVQNRALISALQDEDIGKTFDILTEIRADMFDKRRDRDIYNLIDEAKSLNERRRQLTSIEKDVEEHEFDSIIAEYDIVTKQLNDVVLQLINRFDEMKNLQLECAAFKEKYRQNIDSKFEYEKQKLHDVASAELKESTHSLLIATQKAMKEKEEAIKLKEEYTYLISQIDEKNQEMRSRNNAEEQRLIKLQKMIDNRESEISRREREIHGEFYDKKEIEIKEAIKRREEEYDEKIRDVVQEFEMAKKAMQDEFNNRVRDIESKAIEKELSVQTAFEEIKAKKQAYNNDVVKMKNEFDENLKRIENEKSKMENVIREEYEAEYKETLNNLRNEKEMLSKLHDECIKKQNEIEKQVSTMSDDKVDLEKKIQSLDKTIHDCEDRYKDIQTQLNECENRNAALKSNANECENKYNDVQIELSECKNQNAGVQSQLNDCASQNTALHQRLTEYEKINNDTRLNLSECANQNNALQQRITEYENQNAVLYQQLSALQSENNAMKQSAEGYVQSMYDEYKTKFDALNEEYVALQTQNQRLIDENSQIKVEFNERYQNEVQKFSNEIGNLQSQNTTLKDKLLSLMNENTTLNQNLTALSNENTTLKDKLLSLTNENATLNQRITALSNENTSLKDRMNAMSNENTTLQGNLSTLSNENADLKNKLTSLTNENAALQGNLSMLSDDVSTKTTDLNFVNKKLTLCESNKQQLSSKLQTEKKEKDVIQSMYDVVKDSENNLKSVIEKQKIDSDVLKKRITACETEFEKEHQLRLQFEQHRAELNANKRKRY